MKRRIVIVDDHDAVRKLLCRYPEHLPEYEVVGVAGTGLEIRVIRKSSPHAATINLLLPQLCGHQVILRDRKGFREIRIVVFTRASDASVLASALRSEPRGIVHQSELLEMLLFAIVQLALVDASFRRCLTSSSTIQNWGRRKLCQPGRLRSCNQSPKANLTRRSAAYSELPQKRINCQKRRAARHETY